MNTIYARCSVAEAPVCHNRTDAGPEILDRNVVASHCFYDGGRVCLICAGRSVIVAYTRAVVLPGTPVGVVLDQPAGPCGPAGCVARVSTVDSDVTMSAQIDSRR